jgi:hypothetical protein
VSDDLLQHVDKPVREQRRFTIPERSLEFPQVSRTVLYETVTKKCQMGAQIPGGNFSDVGIQKLVSRYDKCLNSEGDYVDKLPT